MADAISNARLTSILFWLPSTDIEIQFLTSNLLVTYTFYAFEDLTSVKVM